ncbi:unnamed protein product [Lactuca virosa]|uniref:Uncharacterized protein n=1 Tax=Lactuca virosa TaxID=75947 RepID=A0AAU9PQ72_9ASTR|nr:unnamed protein product [Lactuca virosa]
MVVCGFLDHKKYLRMDTFHRRKTDRRDEKLLTVGGFVVEESPKTHLIAGKHPKIAGIKTPVVFLLERGGNRFVNDLRLSKGSKWSRNRRRREVGVIVRKQNLDRGMKST